MKTGSAPRVLAVIGDPIGHSLSPVMHNAALDALGVDAVYTAFCVPRDELATTLDVFRRLGIDGNATLPHKTELFDAVDEPTDRARELRACNTFWSKGEIRCGDNTDVDGVLDALHELGVTDGPWLLVGTGGAARAVVAAAREQNAGIAIKSRSVERGWRFATWAQTLGVEADVVEGTVECPVAINATELGLKPGDRLPIAPDEIRGLRLGLDLLYASGGTPWTRALTEAGATALDGRGMLVGQGVAAFERFFPSLKAPRAVMRTAVDRALGD